MSATLPERVHLVGVGGIGMSGLAELLLARGHRVTGSDVRDSALMKQLRQRGAQIYVGHSADNLDGSQLVVYSSSITPQNPELEKARQKGVPIIHRAEALARAVHGRGLIAVTGAHGKTTTTGLMAQVLVDGGLDPTFFIGGEVASLQGHARVGQGQVCVIEADESDGSFLQFRPSTAIITNIDYEHVDHYRNMEAIKDAFAQFIGQTTGTVWLCVDDHRLTALAKHATAAVRTFGFDKSADVTPWQIKRDAHGSHFVAKYRGTELGECRLNIPGAHNISNALAAIGVAHELGVPFERIQMALAQFSGAGRRFQRVELANGITVIDDYAHHPTEIRATLAAVDLAPGRRLLAVFQPHRYTRTHFLREAYLTCFELADLAAILEIYPAFEPPIADVSAERLVEAMRAAGTTQAEFVPKTAAIDHIRAIAQPGDVIMLLGAGDIGELKHAMVTRLSEISAA